MTGSLNWGIILLLFVLPLAVGVAFYILRGCFAAGGCGSRFEFLAWL